MYGAHAPGWKQAVVALWEWVADHGDVRGVPDGANADGVDLRRWVHARRHEFRQGLLSPDQVVQLEALPGWEWGMTQAQRWERAYAALAVVVAERGSAAVPTTVVVDGVAVGRWVSLQRAAYRAGRLSADRVARLQAVPGWRWTAWPT